ncbi:MAG: hypothetical protein ACREE3_13400, partial [Stellaceae bacterium]
QLVGSDVLTGPMSGCWLVSYRKANGVPHAGHLGTDIAHPVETAAIKANWNNFAQNHPVDVIGGFNPFNAWVGAFPAAERGEGPPRIFGLFTTANEYYIVFTYQQTNPTTMVRIAGVQQAHSSPLATLQHV